MSRPRLVRIGAQKFAPVRWWRTPTVQGIAAVLAFVGLVLYAAVVIGEVIAIAARCAL